MLPWPPTQADADEVPLSRAAIEELNCTAKIRKLAADQPGMDLASEEVTSHPKFGFVYRYQTAEVQNDPEAGRLIFRTHFIVWTTDCQTWSFASVPLPVSRAN